MARGVCCALVDATCTKIISTVAGGEHPQRTFCEPNPGYETRIRVQIPGFGNCVVCKTFYVHKPLLLHSRMYPKQLANMLATQQPPVPSIEEFLKICDNAPQDQRDVGGNDQQ